MLLGSGIDNNDYDNNKKYNIDGYEIICIDEIRLYSPQELKLIDRYMKNNPNIIFTSTGDSDQNVPFSYKPNNIINMDHYIDNCIKIMFNNSIKLKINKRLKTDEDKLKLYNLKKDILDNNIPLIDTFKKNNFNIINKYEDIKTIKNIVYFNKRAARIDKYIHENLIDIPKNYKQINGIKYWEGLDLICRSHLIIKKNKEDENDNKKKRNKKIEDFIDNNGYTFKTNCRLYVNYRYTIDEIKDKFIVLKENVSKIKFLITYNQLCHFKLPYSFTGHSVQGLSIKEKITIFDTNTPYVDRKWVWTAITRARELDNINIFIHSDNEINNLNKSKIKQYFNLKINGYIQQDKKTNRYNPDNYIDFKWFKYNLFFINENNDGKNSYCPKCNIILDLDYDINNNITSNISADRIDNSKGHNKDNIKILCVDCNKKKSNKK